MLFPTTSSLPQSPTPRYRFRLAAAVSAVLLTVGAIGVWQTSGSSDTLVSTTALVAAPPTSLQPITAPLSRVRPGVGSSPSDNATVYLVGSQEEAVRVQAAIDEAFRIRDSFGMPVFATSILVATSDAEEQALDRAHMDTNAIRASFGLSPIPLFNLRAH